MGAMMPLIAARGDILPGGFEHLGEAIQPCKHPYVGDDGYALRTNGYNQAPGQDDKQHFGRLQPAPYGTPKRLHRIAAGHVQRRAPQGY